MAVRNFYIKARADGCATSVGLGPARKDGGLEATISVRHGGGIVEVAEVRAFARADGSLMLEVEATREGMTLYAPEFSERAHLRFVSRR